MTLEEKIYKAAIEFGNNADISFEQLAKNCVAICQEAIDEARLDEHKQTVLYWEMLPLNEIYGIDYHFNRIKELKENNNG